MRLPARDERPEQWPAVDDYIDEPETTRWERVGGQRVWASPAKIEHAAPHARLDYLVVAHAREGYIPASDLKTRATKDEEFASDACLLKDGIDPSTGRRHLEELSFEVVNKRSQSKVDARARAFAARCVRRQIAIFVNKGVVSEWDKDEQVWRPLDPQRRIHDKCLARPLEVAALLDATRADDEVVRALEVKGIPAIVEMKAKSRARGFEEGHGEGHVEGHAEGEAQGLAKAILRVFKSHGVTLDAENRQTILECQDMALLERLFDKAIEASSASEILAELERMDEEL